MTRAISKDPLHFLADVALRIASPNTETAATATSKTVHAAAVTYYAASSIHSFTTPPNSPPSAASLHIACSDSSSTPGTPSGPLRRSSSSNHISCIESTPAAAKHYNTRSRRKRSSHTSPDQLKVQMQMKAKRMELMERAMKIKSLENSPVNDRQLLVLRMVYDEITMYPSEPWMVLLAIVINRAFKQVKNWFSNERQKNRTGEVILIHTKDGDRIRIRPEAVNFCKEWSDQIFEEIVMMHNFKIMRQTRWEASQTATGVTFISNELS